MSARIGVFGKIAGLGDFLRRDLPEGFERPWDAWLQAGLVASRAALGADWAARYSVAPIWRFALGPGLAGPGAAAGLVMPSQDRVGRFFPLTLVAPCPAERAAAALCDAPAFAALEAAALDTLEPDRGPAALEAALARLAPPGGAAGPPLSGSLWRAEAGSGPVTLRFPALPPAEAFARLLAPAAATGATGATA
jgi:type VI secretion system protein ImpM